jgi:hypothetical protein
MSVLQWFGTWIITIALLITVGKTSWGRPIVYGLLWLALLLLILTHADELASFYNVEALNLNG